MKRAGEPGLQLIALLLSCLFRPAFADVMTNITATQGNLLGLGTAVAPPSGSKPNEHTITGGTLAEKNLFHSFDNFSVGENHVANFENDTNASPSNIISRVIGGTQSDIYGTIRTTGFPTGVDLFLINPKGVVFGPGATLDVQGSFHATSADFIRLGDNTFDASTSASQALMITASPEAFGFLDNTNGGIRVIGSDAQKFRLGEGESLSLVGGPIAIVDSQFETPSSSVNIVSVDGQGEAKINGDLIHLDENTPRGEITITNSKIDTTGGDGGKIRIVGGDAQIIDTEFIADNQPAPGRGIVVDVDYLTLKNTNLFTRSEGNLGGGGIAIRAGDGISATDSRIETGDFSATRIAGDISIETGSLNLEDSEIQAESFFAASGDIVISVEREFTLKKGSVIRSRSFFSNPGNISVTSETLDLTEGSVIDSETLAGNESSNISLSATKEITLSGKATRISSRTIDSDGGNLSITTKTLKLSDGARIEGQTEASGPGATVNLLATERITLDGEKTLITTGSGVENPASGDGGTITIDTPRLDVQNNATISAETRGIGQGGNVNVNADIISLTNGGKISTDSQATGLNLADNPNAGKAGSIDITASDTLQLDGSEITAQTQEANAGDIELTVGTLLKLENGSSISTSVAEGTGGGGNIKIDPIFVVLDETSKIEANAAQGSGGNIEIITNFFFGPRDNVTAFANGPGGIDGTVEIRAPDTDILPGTLLLPETFLNVQALLQEPCSSRDLAETSSLVLLDRQGISPTPDGILPGQAIASFYKDDSATTGRNEAPVSKLQLSQIEESTNVPTPLPTSFDETSTFHIAGFDKPCNHFALTN